MPNEREITHDGVTDTLHGWEKRTGIPASTITSRINPDRLGWSIEEALTTPVDRRFTKGGRLSKHAARPCPAMKHNEERGQAYARWGEKGKKRCRFFGPWGSEEARDNYRRFQLEWAVKGEPGNGNATSIADLIVRWIGHCEKEYRKRGKVTSEFHCCRGACRHLNEIYGATRAEEFDGVKLRVVREAMLEEKWHRKTINGYIARIVRCFGWGVGMNLVPTGVHEKLKQVDPLAAGRTEAAERVDRKPVPDTDIKLIVPHLHANPKRREVLAAMVELQLLTGMRPGEICSLRAEDIDQSRKTWRYQVTEFNKMLHKDLQRVILLGPGAREILEPFIAGAEPGKPIFRFPPWRAKADWSPISVVRYRNRIRLACQAAGVPRWVPHQLRHNRATEVMRRYEDDAAAAAAIGDSPEVARQVYAHNPGESVARRIAEETG